jgi:hypothetical protein
MTISGLGSVSIDFVDFPAPFGGLFDSDGNPVQGDVTVVGALPAGSNNIGSVDVATLPALPAGSNKIGSVDVASLPPLPAGSNNIGSVNVASLPSFMGYVSITPITMSYLSATVSASGINTIGTPPSGSHLRKLVISISENAEQATAGENLITFFLNGKQVFSEAIYIPDASVSSNSLQYKRDLDFTSVAFYTGSSGTFTVSLQNALTNGNMYINAYFDA